MIHRLRTLFFKLSNMADSRKYALSVTDLKAIGRGALMAVGGALLTYISSVITATDFGMYTPTVVALWSIILNTARKYVEGYTTPSDTGLDR